MADWWYDNNTKAPRILRDITQIIQNIKPLNDAIANMTLAEAVQYIADKRASGDPIARLVIKYIEHYEDTESDVETYNIGSVNQGGGGRSGGGGAGDVWDEYINTNYGMVSIFGNAEDTEEVIPYLTLISKGGVVSVGVQLFVPANTVVSALLPYVGYEVASNDFYSESVDTLLELGSEILEYTYKGIPIKGLIPAVFDKDNQVYTNEEILTKLRAFTSRWKDGEITNNPLDLPFSPPLYTKYIQNEVFYLFKVNPSYTYRAILSGWKNITKRVLCSLAVAPVAGITYQQTKFIIASDEPFQGEFCHIQGETYEDVIEDFATHTGVVYNSQSATFAGRTVYYLSSTADYPTFATDIESIVRITNFESSISTYADEIAWTMVYGNLITNIPKGIESKPEKIPDWPYPPFVLTNPYTLNLQELVPVNIPEDSPWLTSPADPEEPSTDEAIAPYLWPQVGQEEFYPFDPDEEPELAYNPEDATAPLPDPNNQASTTPVTDPSIPGGVIPAIDLPEFEPPKSDGESPEIGVPDPIDWPSIVPDDTSETHNGDPGLIHVYNPSNSEMQDFGRWLWVTYNDVTLNKIFNNPFDGVIGAHELYATPASFSVKEKIRSGFLVSDVDAYPVLTRYININCGSIVIPEYWGNYLDYAPYTKVHVYLPFIGIVELEADDIIGHSVNINYAVDCYTGACIAQITVAKDNYVNTLYEFQGNCAVEVPLTGGSQAAIKAGLITAAAYGISGVIGTVGNVIGGTLGGAALGVGGMIAGGVIGGLEGLGKTAADAINNVTSLKSSVQHGGTFGSSFGAMGIKKPYIIVKRPIQKVVANYNQDYGYPAHKQVIIGQCTGYLRVLEINIVSPTATNEEKAQIEALLKQGVYVS